MSDSRGCRVDVMYVWMDGWGLAFCLEGVLSWGLVWLCCSQVCNREKDAVVAM